MKKYKILEFKKSQYNNDAIEDVLTEKSSEGWEVVSMYTDVSTDLKGVVTVLLKQVMPYEEKSKSYTDEDVENKRREIEIRRMEAEMRSVESRDQAALNAYQTRGVTEGIRAAGSNESVAGGAGAGIGMLGVAAMTMANNNIGGWTCTCGQMGNLGNFCMNCGNTRPSPMATRICPKCGWKPTDGQSVPKFCPECGRVM